MILDITLNDFIVWAATHFVQFSLTGFGIWLFFKLIKYFVVRHLIRSGIDYNNPYGASELRRDRNPRFFAFRSRK